MKCRSGQVQDARPSGRISRKGWSLLLLVPEAGRGQSVLLAIDKWRSALWGVQSWLCSFTRSTRLSGIWPSCHYSSTFLCYTPAPQAGPDFSMGRTSVGRMMHSGALYHWMRPPILGLSGLIHPLGIVDKVPEACNTFRGSQKCSNFFQHQREESEQLGSKVIIFIPIQS